MTIAEQIKQLKEKWRLEIPEKDYVSDLWKPREPVNTKICAYFDAHYPFNIDVHPFKKFLKDYKPDVFIFGGDVWSLDCISHHESDTFNHVGYDNIRDRFQSEAQGFRDHVQGFTDILPNCKFVYLIGNHEVWIERFCLDHPQLQEINIKTVLHDLPIEFVPQGEFYKIGKLNFCHGDNFGTTNPAKRAVERCKQTIVFGHFHTHKIWPDFSMVDAYEKNMGIQVPCYCKMNPQYIRNRPHDWQNGFWWGVVKPSGNFSQWTFLVSPEGHFFAPDGTEYT